jgi:hypothetical protein
MLSDSLIVQRDLQIVRLLSTSVIRVDPLQMLYRQAWQISTIHHKWSAIVGVGNPQTNSLLLDHLQRLIIRKEVDYMFLRILFPIRTYKCYDWVCIYARCIQNDGALGKNMVAT